jgi:hypothetical protein
MMGCIGSTSSAAPMAEFWPHRKVRGCFRPVTPLSCGSKRFRLAAQKAGVGNDNNHRQAAMNVVEP